MSAGSFVCVWRYGRGLEPRRFHDSVGTDTIPPVIISTAAPGFEAKESLDVDACISSRSRAATASRADPDAYEAESQEGGISSNVPMGRSSSVETMVCFDGTFSLAHSRASSSELKSIGGSMPSAFTNHLAIEGTPPPIATRGEPTGMRHPTFQSPSDMTWRSNEMVMCDLTNPG